MPTIRTKILRGFAIVLIIGALLGITGIVTIRISSAMSVEQKQLQITGAEVTTVLEAHYIWRHNLVISVLNGTPFTGTLDPATCTLGKWINSANARNITDTDILTMMSNVTTPHSYIHTEAQRIQKFIEDGDLVNAESYLNDYVLPKTDEVILILSSMHARCTTLIEEKAESVENLQTLMTAIIIILLIAAVISNIIISLFISKDIEKQLKRIISRLDISMKEIISTVSGLTEVSQKLADGSTKQAAAIQQTSATMNESSSMIAQTTENTRIAAELSRGADVKSKQSLEKMHNMVASMGNLQESSNAISKIVKTIDGIAFNTNLLAINATVEAARTGGEAGKSFSVVADEVRSLALKSAKSAAETSDIITTNIGLTNQCSDMSGSVAADLNAVSEEIKSLTDIIKNINTASEEQSRGIIQISTAMNEMERVTQDNAAVSEETSASSQSLQEEAKNLEAIINEATRLIVGNKG